MYKIFVSNSILNSEITVNPLKKIYRINDKSHLQLNEVSLSFDYNENEDLILNLTWDRFKSINFKEDFLYLKLNNEFFEKQYSKLNEFLQDYSKQWTTP